MDGRTDSTNDSKNPSHNIKRLVGRRLDEFHRHMKTSFERVGATVARFQAQAEAAIATVSREISSRLDKTPLGQDLRMRPNMGRDTVQHLASISMSSPLSGPAIGDIALETEFIRSRLQALSVYTVVNANSEFVLVSGEDGGDHGQQLGLFFFRQKDAEAVIESIAGTAPSLASSTKIIKVSLDRVYDFLRSPEAAALPNVAFRMVPDVAEVSSAIRMGGGGEGKVTAFGGVPVFQAEGLSVRQGGSKYYPLFLSKRDLDVAVGSAQDKRLLSRIEAQEARVRDIRDEAEKLKGDIERAKNERQKNRFSIKLEKAEMRQRKAERRLGDMRSRLSPPKVEVGSLEEVIVRMEADSSGEWSSVMFVPAGQLGNKRDS